MKTVKRNHYFNLLNLVLFLFIVLGIFSAFIPHFGIDLLITSKIQSIDSQVFSNIMWFVSSIGNLPWVIIIIGTTSLSLYLFKFKIEAIISSLSAAGGTLAGALVKQIVDRPRPCSCLVRVSVWLSDKSFPSGHVLIFTVFFGFLLYLLLSKPKHKTKGILLSAIFILLIVTIGISRIYLGAHWASDVLGGYLLGIVWLILTIRIYNSYHGKR